MITLNSKKVKNPGSVESLIKKYGFSEKICVIVNGKIVKKNEWKKKKLKDGDNVEIVGFVGGG